MPFVPFPDDSRVIIINATEGPGVASYISSDGSVRVDIFIGLKLDAFKLYQNISAVHPSVKMEFAEMPALLCPARDVIIVFDSSNSTFITIRVEAFFAFLLLCY